MIVSLSAKQKQLHALLICTELFLLFSRIGVPTYHIVSLRQGAAPHFSLSFQRNPAGISTTIPSLAEGGFISICLCGEQFH